MKLLLILVLIVFVIAEAADLSAEREFELFKVKHEKKYKNRTEEESRFAIFQQNLKKIADHNRLFKEGLSSYEMGVNQFADLTEEEFLQLMGLDKAIPIPKGITEIKLHEMEENEVLPPFIDWRLKGAVSPVKDQRHCGSCWAFSAIGALEGQNQIQNKKMVPLSIQQLVDCTKENQGCIKGGVSEAFKYIMDYGITTEDKYPYTAKQNNCTYKKTDSVLKIVGYTGLPKDEFALKKAVGKVGPISAVIYATSTLQLYTSGILEDKFCRNQLNINHAILIVGYGKKDGQEFWIIKNSWGSKWGEDGYFRYPIGKNMCGIAEFARCECFRQINVHFMNM